MGLIFAIIASLSFVALDVLRKVLGTRIGAARVVIGINLGAALVLSVVLSVEGIPQFDTLFLILALVEGVTFSITSLLYVQAVSRSPLSLTIPYLGFTPLVSALVALLLLGEIPSPRGWAGISLIVTGGILLHMDKAKDIVRLLTAPLREPGSWRMLLVAMVWGLTTSIDKIAIAHGSEALLGFSMSLFSAMILIALVLVRPEQGRPEAGNHPQPATSYPLLIVAAMFAGVAVLAQFYAYRELLVSYVEAVKRAGGLVSALIGVIAFREGSFRSRIPAAAVMLLGMLLIIL